RRVCRSRATTPAAGFPGGPAGYLARLDRVGEVAVVARLFPVVAEDVHARELGHRDLGLARTVRAHQARVLSGLERAFFEQDRMPGRDGDEDVGAEGLFARARHSKAPPVRGGAR